MNEFKHIAAIEISSSKIVGTVGQIGADGSLTITAYHQEENKDAVRFGIIQNPEEVANRVSRIIEQLNFSPAVAPLEIKSVFIGLSGRSLKSIPSHVEIMFPEETEITDKILDNLKKDAVSIAIPNNLEIVEVVPRSYVVDKMDAPSPKGAVGKSISAMFDIIVCRHDIKRNIRRAISDRLGIEIDGYIVTPLAVASTVLTDEEKRLGCMLVDFGAETTTVCIFKKGSLYYFNTIPLGGRNITRDITSLSLLEERAEEIKIESGKAVPRETPSTLNLNGVKLSDVSNLVVARAEEIVANVIHQIFYSELKEKDLPAGIICVGGGSNLNGLLELIHQQSGLNVRTGHLPSVITSNEAKAKRLEAIEIDSIMYAAIPRMHRECLVYPETELPESETYKLENDDIETRPERPEQPTKVKGFFASLQKKIGTMFAPPADEDDSELE